VVNAPPPQSVSASERLYRARRIGSTFGRIYLGAKAQRFIARTLQPPDMPDRWARFNRSSARSVYDAAIELRGLILKGCQFLGSRADVLPREYVQVLSRLQDRVPPRSFRVARATVERELGRDLSELFDEFSPRPVASASLAQVHEARLKNGHRVAVKIQYPEIESLIHGDLANLRFLFRAAGWVERDFDLMPLIDELSTHVPRELDFVNEGRNAQNVAEFFEGSDDVSVPRIHWPYTTRRVLVMDYVDGIKISDVRRLRSAGIDTDRVAQVLVEAYCEQVLGHGFFHADPHPGNILVQPGASGRPRLVFIDFGLTKRLPAHFRAGVVAFAGALLGGDADAMADALLELGFETRDGTPESLGDIARYVLDTAIEFQKRSYLNRDMSERVRRELPDQIRENPVVRVPGHVVLLGRVLALLSGVSRSLGSKVDLVRTVLPYALRR
jgi:predicted unusual protein kinase regulating ubiquinone biosynthesis (AarF/ABC1/UbiB family)